MTAVVGASHQSEFFSFQGFQRAITNSRNVRNGHFVSLSNKLAGSEICCAGGVRTDEIGDIAQKPDDEKRHAEAIGALGLVVGEQLRELEESGQCSPGANATGTQGRTRRHIQEVKLMLPKMPDTASVMGIDRAAAANVVVARSGIAKNRLKGSKSGEEAQRKRGERGGGSKVEEEKEQEGCVVRQRWVSRGQSRERDGMELIFLP